MAITLPIKPPVNAKPDYFTIETYIRKEKTDDTIPTKTNSYWIQKWGVGVT
jgi:hypothetical protein